jgi:hypothetical protein
MGFRVGVIVCVFLSVCLYLGPGAEGAEGKLKGYMFGDYYYIASGPDKKENGFQFRRVYLTYDMKWNDGTLAG